MNPLILAASLCLAACGCSSLVVDASSAERKNPVPGVAVLRCEYLDNPVGIAETHPRFSWVIQDSRRGAAQSAYQILVASSGDLLKQDKGDLWDSGKVASGQTSQVEYAGAALKSRQLAHWKVRSFGATGQATAWSRAATFEMGLLESADWKASWIQSNLSGGKKHSIPVPYFRKNFASRGNVVAARLYASALGVYEFQINGQRVGDDAFAPGWPDYHKRAYYRVYDVTSLIKSGDNVVGALLGDGWYCGYLVWKNNRETYGDRPRLLAQLELTYADGSTQTVVTDASWKFATGAILESDIYNGESVDARLEPAGWSLPAFNDSAWKPAEVFPAPKIQLTSHPGQAVRRIMEKKSLKLTEPKPGVFIFDIGQNLTGTIRLAVNGTAGHTVTLRYGEMLKPDGTLYTANLRSAKATDHYTLSGKGAEIYEPKFTFHGFRYVEVTNFPGKPTTDTVAAIVLHSDMTPTGTFECSNALVNQLQQNIQWGQRGNFLDVPTDCPQRDERLGWTGDAEVFVRTASYNMDTVAFYSKWMYDLTDSQRADGDYTSVAPDVLKGNAGGPGWSDCGVIVPWTIYRVYGDKRLVARHYDSMARFIEFLKKSGKDLIHPDRGYGDWLAFHNDTPKSYIGTAYFAHCCRLMADMATALGKSDDAAKYTKLAEEVREAFIKKFVGPDGQLIKRTQTTYLLALQFDLLPADLRPRAIDALVKDIQGRKNHLSTGFIGTPLLNHVLSATGHNDVAFALLLQDTCPAWLFPVKNGATTMWERWDSWTPDKGFGDVGMNSFNHYAYGAIGEWLYQTVAGIDTDGPGYTKLLIKPTPGGGLTYVKAGYDSIHGRIESNWRIENGVMKLSVVIPANTTATAYLPCDAAERITESGKPLAQAEGITDIHTQWGKTLCHLTSGSYEFVLPAPK